MGSETVRWDNSRVTDNADGVNGGNLKAGKICESNPPPFLKKLFEMVEDPETNSTISWNSTGTSFIIWDHNKFAAEILHKYFRTSIFSSFVYQLNSYGFRKISYDLYEYENPWFQAGKKDWLNNIKRRKPQSQNTKKLACLTLKHDSMNAAMETELQVLLTEQKNMKGQIQQLKESLGNLEHQLTSIKENTEILQFNDENLDIQVFSKEFMQLVRQKKDQASKDNTKKARLIELQSTESAVDGAEKVKISRQNSSSADDSETQIQVIKENAESSAFWKRIPEENAGFSVKENPGNLAAHHSKAIVELDEMMASQIAMGTEDLIPDLEVEDYATIELWT